MIRRHGKRPTIALWMLVAIADVALVMAAVGTLAVLFTVAVAAILAAGVLMLQRRTTPQQESILRRRA
jgi:hypothetical protein